MTSRRRGQPRPTTLDKVAQVDQLTRSGWCVLDACYQAGLDPQTWYRHSPRPDVDQLDGLLDVLTALAGKAA
jgi:hypothetical protein